MSGKNHGECLNTQVDLSGVWGFQVDVSRVGRNTYPSQDFDSSRWRLVDIPCGFDACAPGMERFVGVCWFRKAFQVPSGVDGRKATLRFEAINYNAQIWLNGVCVGESSDPFLPIELDVTERLEHDQPNLLVVRVDNLRAPAQLPLFEGWFGQGGILREVHLIFSDFLRLEDARIVAEPTDGGGSVEVTAGIVNERSESVTAQVKVDIFDLEKRKIGSVSSDDVTLGSGKRSSVTLRALVEYMRVWSPDSPVLYLATLSLIEGEECVHVIHTGFGFRRVERRGREVMLNGKPLTLVGFNRHEDSPRTGMAVDLETARQDLSDMKRMGANFVRLCHYPHHPGELDICDELGLLVMGEIPLNGWGLPDYPKGGYGWDPVHVSSVVDNATRQLKKMVKRDFNHPSVVFWSVCNEPDEAAHEEIVDGIRDLISYGKTLDPTRLWTHASNNWSLKSLPDLFREDEVICINGYPSKGQRLGPLGAKDPEGERFLSGSAREDFSESVEYWRTYVQRLRDRYPEKPILVTELGYPSVPGVDGPLGEDIQALATIAEMEALEDLGSDYVVGIVLWVYAKHAWPSSGFPPFTFQVSPYGYVSRDRKMRMAALESVETVFRRLLARAADGEPSQETERR